MNKLQAVVQRFRSGSVEPDKVRFNLDVDESRARSFSNTEVDQLKDSTSSTSGRKSDMEALKLALSRTAALQTQQLQNSNLVITEDTGTAPADKKMHKKQPSGTFEYSVEDRDTLVRIGARFDVTPSELIIINKLLSRTVFVGQILYIPEPRHAGSSPSPPKCSSPMPLVSISQADNSAIDLPLVTDHAVPGVFNAEPVNTVEEPVTDAQLHQEANTTDDQDKEELNKCLKMPVRRVLEEEHTLAVSKGFTVKGTLLVSPIAIMFDPDVSDTVINDCEDPQKFSAAVYMEELKSIALFHDISPRMFWKQPKELRAHSPKPEPYRCGQDKKSKDEGHDEKAADTKSQPPLEMTNPNWQDLAGITFDGDSSNSMAVIHGEDTVDESGEDTAVSGLLDNGDQHLLPSETQQGMFSDNLKHILSSSEENIPASPTIRTGSSELKMCTEHHEENPTAFMEIRDLGPPRDRSKSEIHILNSEIPNLPLENKRRHFSFTDHSVSPDQNRSVSAHGFQPLLFTDLSPTSVTTHPKPISRQTVLVLSNSPITCTDVDEDIQAAETCSTKVDNYGELICTETNFEDHFMKIISDGLCQETKPSAENLSNFSSDVACESQTSKVSDGDSTSHLSDEKLLSAHKKGVPGHGSSWSEKTQTVVDKLAFQLSSLTWESAVDQTDGSTKPPDNSPRSVFSPLRTPAHHISNLFNYTTSFFQRPGSVDKDNSLATQSFSSEDKSKHTHLSSAASNQLCLKSDFKREDIIRALGPDPKEFMMRSDSLYFKEAPLYLQIRRGIQKNAELLQPRAFDHWNKGPLLDEYWFVVPKEMGDKLYNFVMTWQPDAYGDEEETEPRGRFFYDIRSVNSRRRTTSNVGSAAEGLPNDLFVSDESEKEMEKSWEIISKENAYQAEKEQSVYRQDTIDESNLPELIGPTVIVSQDHLIAILRSLPRNMSVGYNWELVYATHRHGYSLQNLYMRTEAVEFDLPVLLFIMDTNQTVFGAFLSNTIRPNDTFYGSGATFLFTFYPEFKKFSWRGDNQFFMHGNKEFFAVGSGEGLFGLWLDGSLDKGRSHPCTTFHNDVLAREEDFSILQLEVWKFVDSSLC